MSRLEQLIAKFCPDGVEYLPLFKVLNNNNASDSVSKIDYKEVGKIPIIDQSQSYIAAYTDNESAIPPVLPCIIFGDHTRVVKFADQKFAQGDSGTKVFVPVTENFNTKYVYYAFSNLSIPSRGYNRHWSIVKDIQIPIPPLPIQEEIVRILDTFTALEAELEKELEARTKQYEFYRDALLKSYEKDFRFLSIGEIFDTVTDFVAAGSFADLRKNVVYKSQPDYAQLVRTTDLKTDFSNGGSVYVSESAFKYLWRVNLEKEAIILPNVGNCGEVYYVTPDILPYENNVLGPNAILVRSSEHNNKFLSYLLQTSTFQKSLSKITSPGGQTKFNKTELRKIILPIPPLPVQEEIVAILDHFDALVNDLKNGLPAEIAAHRKQYEYYRDQLLTFKPLE